MIRVHKYEFPINDLIVLNLPEGAVVLKVDCQGNEPMLWALIDTEADLEYRAFQVHGTGHDVVALRPDPDWEGILEEDVALEHVESFQHRSFVWHVFERVPFVAE